MNDLNGNRVLTRQNLEMTRKNVKGKKKKSQIAERKSLRGKINIEQSCEVVKNETELSKNMAGNLEEDKFINQPSPKIKIWWSRQILRGRKELSTSGPKVYSCSVCGMAFNSLGNLKRHKAYYRDPTFPCKLCGMKLSDKKQLDKHIQLVHVLKKVTKFKLRCPFCGHFFIMLEHLRSHMYHYHKGWDDGFSNSADSEAEMIKMATLAALEESKVSKIAESVLPSDFDNPFEYGAKKTDEKSQVPTIDEPIVETNNIADELCDSPTAKIEKTDTNRSFVKSSENDVVFIANESEHVEVLRFDFAMDVNTRETELRTFYSCKDCYIPLTRVNVNRTKRQRRDSSISARSSASIDLSEKNTKYLKLDEAQSSSIACHLCGDVFDTEAERQIHIEWRHTFIPSIICNKKFRSRTAAHRHYRERHCTQKGGKTYCDCGMKFAKRMEIRQHFFQNAHKVVQKAKLPVLDYKSCKLKPKKYECKRCNTTFPLETCLKYHQSRKCEPKPVKFNEPVMEVKVGKEYLRPAPKNKPVFCSVCGKKFLNAERLLRHEEFFACTPPHPCPICGTVFKGNRQTSSHIAMAHKDSSMTYFPFRCRICNHGFKTSAAERMHRMHYHPNKSVGIKVPSDTKFKESPPVTDSDMSDEETDNKSNIPVSKSTHRMRHRSDKSLGMKIASDTEIENLPPMTDSDMSDDELTKNCNIQASQRLQRLHDHSDSNVEMKILNDTEIDESSPMTDSDMSDDEITKKCNICDLEFSSNKHFIDHLIYYTKHEIIECSICLEEFEGQYKAHHHNKLIHYPTDSRNALTYPCGICHEGFMWKILLQAHLSHVHGIPAIEAQCITNLSNFERQKSGNVSFRNVDDDTCKICDVTFASPVLLAAHEIENLNDGEFVCNKCSRRCRTSSLLLDHLSLNHASSAIQDGVKCRRCNENFQTLSLWISHVKHFHFTNEPSEFYFEKNFTASNKNSRGWKFELIIPTNHSIASGMSTLRIKGLLADNSNSATAMSYLCGSVDIHNNIIKIEESHSTTNCSNSIECNGLATETMTNEIQWKCLICGMNCSGSAELDTHAMLYSDDGEYMCELCGRRFAWEHIYQEHREKHYRSSCDKYFCQRCNEGFETLQCKISHDAHLHKDSDVIHLSLITSSSANNQLLLPEQRCEQAANSSNSHTEIFEDELSMIYHCPNCHEKYPTLDRLNKHLAIVHNLKQDPIVDCSDDLGPSVQFATCELCDIYFNSNDLLNIHRKMTHHSLRSEKTQKIDAASSESLETANPSLRVHTFAQLRVRSFATIIDELPVGESE